jgi:hypothetical protein
MQNLNRSENLKNLTAAKNFIIDLLMTINYRLFPTQQFKTKHHSINFIDPEYQYFFANWVIVIGLTWNKTVLALNGSSGIGNAPTDSEPLRSSPSQRGDDGRLLCRVPLIHDATGRSASDPAPVSTSV